MFLKPKLWQKPILAIIAIFIFLTVMASPNVAMAEDETLTPYTGQVGSVFYLTLTNVAATDIGVKESTDTYYLNVIKTPYDALSAINFEITLSGSGTSGYSAVQAGTAPYIKIYDSTRTTVVAEYNNGEGALKFIGSVDGNSGGVGSVNPQPGTVVTMGLDANTLAPGNEYYLTIEPGLKNKRNPANEFGKTVWFRFVTSAAPAPVWASDAALTVSDVSGSSFNVSWPAAAGAESYKVVVSNTTGGVITDVLNTTISDGSTTCPVTGLTANRHYDIEITAANAAGDSAESLKDLVVTTPDRPLFTFNSGIIAESGTKGRYLFQPAGTNGTSTTYTQAYTYDEAVNPAETRFLWYMQAGFNGTDARDHVNSFRLFNLTDDLEISLDYGTTDFGSGTTGWTPSGVTESDTGYTLTHLMASGDFKVARMQPSSTWIRFELDIAKYLVDGKAYAITIDPQFHTGGKNPNVLGKVYSFVFTTNTGDTQAPAWGEGAQITVGAITDGSVGLSWPAATDDNAVDHYKITATKNGSPAGSWETTNTSFTVTGLDAKTQYSFSVTAVDTALNESSSLAAVTATTLSGIPVWPDNAALTADGVMATELILRWPQVSNAGDLAGYKVYVDGVEETSLPAIQNYYELYGLNSGHKYILSVKPFNELGQTGTAIETIVVTPGAGGLTFTFAPTAVDRGEAGYYHNYDLVSPVDLDNFSLIWNFSNGLDKNLRFNLECVHLFDEITGQELNLDLGTAPYVSTLEGVFYAGDFKYISTGGGSGTGSGDGSGDTTGKVRMLKFEPGAPTLAQMSKGTPYVIEIDPEFTANNGTAKLGKIFTFAFTTAVDDTEAPAWPTGAQLTAGKVGPDAMVISWPQASDNIGVIEYQLYRQGDTLELIQALDSQTTSYNVEGLTPDTTYHFVLRGRDAKSNYTPDLTLAVKTLLTDDQAPTWPAGSKLTADNILTDNLDLNWTPAVDNVDVTGYRLLKNGSVVTDFEDGILNYHVAQLTPGTAYIFKVEARDKAGNYSSSGPKLVISTIDGEADTTPPYWTGNGSSSTSTVYGYDQTRVTYHWPWAADNVAVTAYLVYRNDVQVATLDAYTNSYTDTLDVDNTNYTYSVYAVDAAGNRSVEGRRMTVNSGNPDRDTYSPIWPAGTDITLSDFTDDSVVKVKWTPAQDNVGIRGYVVVKDGLWVEWADKGEPDTATRSFTDCFVVYNPYINYAGVPSSAYPALISGETYTFSVKAFDMSENSSKGDPKITFVMGTNPTAGAGIPFVLTNVENKRGSLNNVTGALNQIVASQDPEQISFTWQFDEPLAAGYESQITLTDITSGTAVNLDAANFQYSESSGKGVLTLDLAATGIKLLDNTQYVVELDKTITSQSGKQLGLDIAWQFATDYADKEGPEWAAGDTLGVSFNKAPAVATLTWPAAGDNVAVTKYMVYQGDVLLATLPGETLTYDVPGLAINNAYNFKIVAGDYLNNFSSPLSAPVITPAADITAPVWEEGVALTFSEIVSDNVTVSWPAATDNYQVKGYRIYRDGVIDPLTEVAADVLQYTINGLAGENIYNITVKAFDYTGNERELTGSVNTIADTVNPNWPEGSQLQAKNIRDTSVTLYWDAAADNVGVTRYNIYRDGGIVQNVSGDVTELTVDGLSGSTEYTFTVEAEDLKGNKTAELLILAQWTAPNSVNLGAAFTFNLEKPLSHNVSVDLEENTLNNVVDGSFTKNNVAFTFSFGKQLAEGTWLDNIELRDSGNTVVSLVYSNFNYFATAGDTSKLALVVPASQVSNGQYVLTIKKDLQAADGTRLGRNFIWSFNVSVGMYGVTDIAAGYNSYSAFKYPSDRYYLMLKDDGSVWTWGNNDYGTLGDGTYDRRDIPTVVEGLTGITALEAGQDSCFALDQDGAVWAWGSNEYGQLGKGTVPSGTSGRIGNNISQKIAGLPVIEKLSYGFGNVVALDTNGEVWNWGFASKAGLSTNAQCSGTPLKVSGLADVLDVAAGFRACLAVTGNGDVYTFSRGQAPVKVEGLSEIVALDAQGIDQRNAIWMALKSDGTAYIWDSNNTGSFTNVPMQVADASLVKAVIADGPYVLGTNGQVSSVDYSAAPTLGTDISDLNNVVKLASSAQGGLALQTDGTLLQFIGATVTPVDLSMDPADLPVWSAGSKLSITNLAETGLTLNWVKPDANVSGFAIMQDGSRIATVSGDALSYDVLGLTKGQSYTFKIEARYINSDWTTTGPVVTQTMNDWNPTMQCAGKIAMSGKHTLLVGDDGSVWSWGQNEYGQLGLGNNSEQLTPVKISSLSGIVAVAVGDNHSLALDNSGNVWVWGKNNLYQLGNDSTTDSNVPIKIISGGVKAISAAADHSFALKNDGTVVGWGEGCSANCSYALTGGKGHIPVQMCYNNSNPSDIHPFTGVKGIAASRGFTVYLFDDGRICRQGSFIDEVGAPTYWPMRHYSAPLGIAAIAAGENFVAALKEDGTVLSLGDNNFGQYGDGTQGNGTPANPRPYGKVAGLSNIVAIAAGGYHGLALGQNGQVYTWGKNLNGQLGTGKTDIHLTPVKVAGLQEITAIGGGTESSIAFRNMEKIYVWGNNDDGQFGNDSKTSSNVPTLVNMAGYDIDIDAPLWPAYFTMMGTDVTKSSVTLLWSPASDNVGVTGYEIYVNNIKQAVVDGAVLEYTACGLAADMVYTFGVKAVDAAGNSSVMKKTVINTAKADASGGFWPYGSILSASDIRETSLTLTWTPALGNMGVAGYKLFQDGSAITSVSSDVYTYDVTELAAGTQYSFKVEAGNAGGLWSTDGPGLSVVTAVYRAPGTVLFSMPYATSKPGQSLTVPVNIAGGAGTAAFQFSLDYDPALISGLQFNKGLLIAGDDNWTVSSAVYDDNLKVVGYNKQTSGLTGGEGELLNLTFTTEYNTFNNESVDLVLEALTVSDALGEPLTSAAANGKVTIVARIKGDVSGDNQCDVLDVVKTLNIALDKIQPTTDEFYAADANGDSEVNVLDVVKIVNTILGIN